MGHEPTESMLESIQLKNEVVSAATGWSYSILLWPHMSRKAWRPRGRGWRYQGLPATPTPPSSLIAGEMAMAFRGNDRIPSIL